MVDFMLMAVKKARQRLPMEVGTCSCITCFLRAKVPPDLFNIDFMDLHSPPKKGD